MVEINLKGPEGNAFALMGAARRFAKQLGKDPDKICEEMMESDYDHLLDVFEREFGNVVELVGRDDG